MPEIPPTAVLRLEPHMIPTLRAAYENAVATLRPMLEDLRWRGRIAEPWMGDPISHNVVVHYHNAVMDEANPVSAYSHLRAYERELTKIVDTLAAQEAEYRRTEGDNVELWGRFA